MSNFACSSAFSKESLGPREALGYAALNFVNALL